MTWLRAGHMAFPWYGPTSNPPVVFRNAVADLGEPDKWLEAEIPAGAPADAVAAHVVGILIISHPGKPGVFDPVPTADLHLRLRRALGPDNPYLPDYIGQVCEAQPGGVRSPFASWVALEGRKFEYHWTRNTPPPYPQYPSYGFKLYVDAVVCEGE